VRGLLERVAGQCRVGSKVERLGGNQDFPCFDLLKMQKKDISMEPPTKRVRCKQTLSFV
jgi:hypothetical protein